LSDTKNANEQENKSRQLVKSIIYQMVKKQILKLII